MKDLSQLATSVMQEVAREQLVKQGSATYINRQPLKTQIGQLMQKVASQLRTEGSVEITYTDLERFRKQYAI